MRTGSLLLACLALAAVADCQGQVQSRRVASLKMLRNLNHVSRHLRDLSSSLGDYDKELTTVIYANRGTARLHKRSTDDEFMSDLRSKQRLLDIMKNVFDYVQRTMDRHKKWATCNLNLGFTCQTEQFNEIADFYDFLNSAHSPGKKRSLPADALVESS